MNDVKPACQHKDCNRAAEVERLRAQVRQWEADHAQWLKRTCQVAEPISAERDAALRALLANPAGHEGEG
jgi:hypothetical protein